MNSAANIIATKLDAGVTSYTISDLPGFEARIGLDNWKDPKSKCGLTLRAHGAYIPRHAGKSLKPKTAERYAREWLEEMWARRDEWIAPKAVA